MTNKQKAQTALTAVRLIDEGCDPDSLVYLIYHPDGHELAGEEIAGLSKPLPPGSDVSKAPEAYFTLAELAWN